MTQFEVKGFEVPKMLIGGPYMVCVFKTDETGARKLVSSVSGIQTRARYNETLAEMQDRYSAKVDFEIQHGAGWQLI